MVVTRGDHRRWHVALEHYYSDMYDLAANQVAVLYKQAIGFLSLRESHVYKL